MWKTKKYNKKIILTGLTKFSVENGKTKYFMNELMEVDENKLWNWIKDAGGKAAFIYELEDTIGTSNNDYTDAYVKNGYSANSIGGGKRRRTHRRKAHKRRTHRRHTLRNRRRN